MKRIVVVGYEPKSGRERELDALIGQHMPILRAEGLVTERKPIIMRSDNGTVIEIFEWRSKEAIESAHSNVTILDMWQKFAAVCNYVPVSQLHEMSEIFSEFKPVN